jgi:hypothetical protein
VVNLDNLSRIFLVGVGFLAIFVGIFGGGKLRTILSGLIIL